MKNPIYTAACLSLATTSLLHAQEFTFDLNGVPSFDAVGSEFNIVVEEAVGSVIVTNISWTNVTADGAGGPSYGSEMAVQINDVGYIPFFPDDAEATAGGVWGPAEGGFDLQLQLENIRLEFFELFDDATGEADANYTGGSITLTYTDAGDCNSNGIDDDTELSPDTDCDNNGALDECEIAGAGDCNDNGLLDACESTPENDCDSNGIPDECEIDIFDCDANGVLDVCDSETQQNEITFDTGILDGGAVGPTYTFDADGSWNRFNVDLEFNNVDGDDTWAADLVFLFTDPAGNCFQVGGFDTDLCAAAAPAAFPAAWQDPASGNYVVEFGACGTGLSGPGTWSVQLSHGYSTGLQDQWSGTFRFDTGAALVIDCNENGIDDADEITPETDCNTNGALDECELASGDCDANGVLDSCEGSAAETELAFDTGVLNGGQSVELPVALSGSLLSLGVQLDFNNVDADPTWAGDLLIQLTSPAGDCIEVGGFDLSNCGDAVAADFDATWDVIDSAAYEFTFNGLTLCNNTAGDWAVQLMHGYGDGLADQWSGTLTIGTTDQSGPVCPGDLDDSGAVDFGDIVRILSNWGSTGPEDLDGSGIVDFSDLVVVLSTFGPC